MAIDIENEQLLTLTEATKVLPRLNGRQPAISTLWRWCRKGVRGVRLEYVRIGRNIATSREALGRFFNALARADQPPGKPRESSGQPDLRPTPAARKRMLDEADRVLKKAGIS